MIIGLLLFVALVILAVFGFTLFIKGVYRLKSVLWIAGFWVLVPCFSAIIAPLYVSVTGNLDIGYIFLIGAFVDLIVVVIIGLITNMVRKSRTSK